MAYGKLKADTLEYDNSGSDVEVTISSLGAKANLASPDFTTDITLKAQAPVKFEDDAGGEYVGLKAPTGVTTYTVTLPAAAPSTGQVLKASSSTALSWSADTALSLLDEDNFATNSATAAPSQQSVKAYVDAHIIDEDNFSSDSATKPASQQSVKAYVDTADALKGSLAGDQTWTGSQRGSINALTSASTITIDMNAGNNHSVTLGHNTTFANPTNQTAGQAGSIFITQDGTGSRTAAWGSNFLWKGGTVPTLSTAAASVDRIDYIILASTKIHAVATLDIKAAS